MGNDDGRAEADVAYELSAIDDQRVISRHRAPTGETTAVTRRDHWGQVRVIPDCAAGAAGRHCRAPIYLRRSSWWIVLGVRSWWCMPGASSRPRGSGSSPVECLRHGLQNRSPRSSARRRTSHPQSGPMSMHTCGVKRSSRCTQPRYRPAGNRRRSRGCCRSSTRYEPGMFAFARLQLTHCTRHSDT